MVTLRHRGNIILLHGDPVALCHIIDEGVKGGTHRSVVIPGGKILFHIAPQDALESLLLRGTPTAAPAHVIIPHRSAVVHILQGQHQQYAVVAFRRAYPQAVKLPGSVVGNALRAGGVHHLHGDLGAGLSKEGCVHGVNIRHGILADDPLGIHHILITAGDGGGCLGGLIRPPGLADEDACHNGQHHHHCRHRTFLQEFHRSPSRFIRAAP